jgi:hypothetical protein
MSVCRFGWLEKILLTKDDQLIFTSNTYPQICETLAQKKAKSLMYSSFIIMSDSVSQAQKSEKNSFFDLIK